MKRPQRTHFSSPAPSPWVCPISGHVVTSHPEARTAIRSGTADSSPRHRPVISRSCPRPPQGMHLNACIPASPAPGRAARLQRGSPRLNLSFRPRACAGPRPRPGPASPCPQVSCHRALCLVPPPRQARSHEASRSSSLGLERFTQAFVRLTFPLVSSWLTCYFLRETETTHRESHQLVHHLVSPFHSCIVCLHT